MWVETLPETMKPAPDREETSKGSGGTHRGDCGLRAPKET